MLSTGNGSGGKSLTVSCPTGKKAIGGGASDSDNNGSLYQSYPTAGNAGWFAASKSAGGITGHTLTVYAICATVQP